MCLSDTLALTGCPSTPCKVCHLLNTLCRFDCRTMSNLTPGSHMCPQEVLPSSSFYGHGCSGMIPVLSGLQKHHLKVCNRLSEVQASCSMLQSAFASLHSCLHLNSQLSCEGTSMLSAHVAQDINDHVAAYTPVQVALFCWQAETHCPSDTQDTAACAVAIHTSVWYLTHFSTRKCFASLISNSPCTHMTFKHLLDLFLLELKSPCSFTV